MSKEIYDGHGQFKNLSIGLLISDSDECDNLVITLNKLGIDQIEVFDSLKNLWQESLSRPTNLIIADIRLMNSENFILKDHPLIQARKVLMTVFYKNTDIPLFRSLNNFTYFGKVMRQASYREPLYDLLGKLSHVVSLEQKIADLNNEKRKYALKAENTQNILSQMKNKETYRQLNLNLIKKFNLNYKVSRNFLNSLVQTLEQCDFVDEFILFRIDKEKQKLISVKAESEKCKRVPPVVSEQSFTSMYFREATMNVALAITNDLFGAESKVIKVNRFQGRTQFILSLKVSNDVSSVLDENLLESILSARYQNSIDENLSDDFLLTGWKFFEQVKRASSSNVKRKKLFRLNLSSLVDQISTRGGDDFYWSEFFNSFIHHLSKVCHDDLNITQLSFKTMYLLTSDRVSLTELRKFLGEFKYWTFFEDTEQSFLKFLEIDCIELKLGVSDLEDDFFGTIDATIESIPVGNFHQVGKRDQLRNVEI